MPAKIIPLITIAIILLTMASISGCVDKGSELSPRIIAVKEQVANINARATLISDVNDIEFLQRAYGFYIDEMLWNQVLDLLTDDATMEIGTSGVYVGKDSIRAYLYSLTDGKQGPIAGRLNNHFQLQPVIHIAPDGKSAQGRWHTLIQTGIYGAGSGGQWGEGVYENAYIKEDDVWKIKKLHLYINYIAPYEGGWKNASVELVDAYSKGKGVTPDQPTTDGYAPFPTVYTPPFHYDNPVTQSKHQTHGGENTLATLPSNTGNTTIAELEAAIADAELQIQKLESIEQLENIEGMYGYYVDRSQHDLLADLFAEDASLEILGRGLFIGQDRIRAYMHNLGPVGPQPGRLFTHMQFQPITHLSEDGQTAQMRSRLMVMFGIENDNAQWGEGIYENIFSREDGVWKIKKLHAYQVYYTYYQDGWAKKSSAIFAPFDRFPPDYPPTVDYEPYPSDHVPPFHYRNPVSGK